MLYNPGGFRQEFHQLRLPKGLSLLLVLVGLLVMSQETTGGSIPAYGLILLLVVWFVQGLAVVHGAIGKLGLNSGWLVGVYLLLLFAMLHMVVVLALVGAVDAWLDFRARLRPGRSGGTS
jgi:hypothetical protein